ncbi:HRDC domain-containing protein [Desulfuromonas acetoxidans]|uniref:3'-5' exonuclease n=1 Tax=Desulfuromonas acetoxidans (strain DSM 684 / 11070) TaxID=281689 RepID=Q1K3W9_DESA6|nr:HRDC domain-containing protein [Desulfuromonas acetoxidans]EAT17334.1 3'-5' exonuclease [Desulfuromonas acetoxidans DSM 684]MBF0644283.1 ribonuclease D [Desulfuromonas acetoxidans]NVD24847.1 ribonuclease D [Desulfuromonas acetoxidans]NVE15148.1 ribonuclease D [Desulfuromonas acetoxidans]
MTLPPILTTDDAVVALAKDLETCAVFAVDLEADSMHSYQEKVCLLQFTYHDTTVLLDPLAAGDLAPLKPVLADSSIRKIFHAADYDIRCLARDFDIEIRGLFDTMIASQFLGEEKVGLADVLGKYFDVTLDKRFQRADWSKRPLSPEMCHYAAEDTRHLEKLVAILEPALKEKDRLWWVEEEFRLLEQAKFRVHDGPAFLRIKGAGTMPPRALAILECLLEWREKEAQRRDCPAYKVVGNKPLLSAARHMPTTMEALKDLEEFPARLADRYGRAVLKQIETGQAVDKDQLPHFPRRERRVRDVAAEERFNRLKSWRSDKAKQLEMDPGIVINNALLEAVARSQPRNAQDLMAIDGMKEWQRKVLGPELIASLHV